MTDNTQATRTITINLDALVLDPSTQIRSKTFMAMAREYREAMRAGAHFPPVTVAQVDPEDHERGFVLIDGWHRVTATKELGRGTIDAVVAEGATPEQYRWLAAQSNRTHGLRLDRKDRREVFRAYVQAGQHRTGRGRQIKSAREMARDLEGIVSDRRIPEWMRQDFPHIHKAMKGGGIEENPGADFGKTDMDAEIARIAADCLTEFKACFRTIKSTDLQEDLLRQITETARDVAEVSTGQRTLPALSRAQSEEF